MRGRTHGAPVFLCGMMGSGKTTVGRALASHRGCPFIDLDQRIARIFGRSIPELFAERGESGFREAESLALRGLLAEPAFSARDVVVATGGGIVLRAEHRAWMRSFGRDVFLDVPLETLVERLLSAQAMAARPLLTKGSDDTSQTGQGVAGREAEALRRQLQALWAAREPLYTEVALRVDGRGSPQDVLAAVVSALDPAA